MKHTVEVVVDRAEGARRREAAARRIVRDRAAPRGRPRARGRDRQRPRASVLREVRLSDVQLFAAGARAAPVLVQQSDGRVPALRRAGHDQFLRSQARGRVSRAVARARARSRAGTGATSSISRCCSRLAQHYGFDLETPFGELPEAVQQRRAVRLRAATRSGSPISASAASSHRASTRSKASSRTSSAATGRPNRWSCARSSPSI